MADTIEPIGTRTPTEIPRTKFWGEVWEEEDEGGNVVRKYAVQVRFDVLDQGGDVIKTYRGVDPRPHLDAANNQAGKQWADALLDKPREIILP